MIPAAVAEHKNKNFALKKPPEGGFFILRKA